MPLEHSQAQLEGNVDLSALGVHAGTWCPGQPGRVTEVGLTLLTDISAAGAVQFIYRPTAGSTTGEVTFATINLAATNLQGQQIKKDLNQLRQPVTPGSEVVAEVTDLTAATELAKAYLWYDFEGWENADNLPNKFETT